MASFYDNDTAWSAPGRQSSWEQQAAPSRSNTASALSQQPEYSAFASQFEEIDRATDNLMKSGKWFPGQAQPAAASSPARRESMPVAGRPFEYGADARLGAGPPSRHHSVSEFDGNRPGSAGLQGFYQGQRFPGGRQSEAEQMLQAKRRMAAQRERELRNYHQEQQYNRRDTTSGAAKSDRSMSPNTMSEDDRRELIARQHRALYGDNASLYNQDGSRATSQSGDARNPSAGRGPSPLAFDTYGVNAQSGAEGVVQMPPRDRAENAASPASTPSAQQPPFNLLNDGQAASRTSNSSPGASPPLTGSQKNSLGGVAPIGTRPTQAPGAAPGLSKRSTTPLTPSSLSYGFSAEQSANLQKDERSTSAASNPALADKGGVPGLGNWGSNSGVWGNSKNTLAVQPSVWG